ncbi:hypothetical protein Tco_0514728 [Tanacetum coccineum]
MTTTIINNSVFKAFFKKQKLTGPNFIDWYHNLYIMLSVKDKLTYLEHPMHVVPVPVPGQEVPLDVLAARSTWVKASKEIVGLMLMIMDPDHSKESITYVNYNMHGMGKTVNELHAMLKLHEQPLLKSLEKELSPVSHQGDEEKEGLKGSKKLKPRALNLYVGNGHRAAVEAIRTFHLCLPSGLVVVLNNCHFAPSITIGIISVSRLYDDGFINRFENDAFSISMN